MLSIYFILTVSMVSHQIALYYDKSYLSKSYVIIYNIMVKYLYHSYSQNIGISTSTYYCVYYFTF